jgi:hypothetical protein
MHDGALPGHDRHDGGGDQRSRGANQPCRECRGRAAWQRRGQCLAAPQAAKAILTNLRAARRARDGGGA